MKFIDFTDHKNRDIRFEDISDEYVKEIKRIAKNSTYYPLYHIAPPCGLMNDPNGLCQINGWYHVFYQWFPFGPVHGLKHWYHLRTKDFIHFEDLGVAMMPDSPLDRDGCFTGCAHIEERGCFIYYTGVVDGVQQVVRASFDGDRSIFDKELCVPIDTALTTHEFRDPCLYDNFMFIGAQDLSGKGMIAVYEKFSSGYDYKGRLNIPENLTGNMIECPNVIAVDEEHTLMCFSPMGIESPDDYTYRNVFSVVCSIGVFNKEGCRFESSAFFEMDHGFDFYAPQLFHDEAGRLIMLAWLGNSKCIYPSDYEQWAHMMTIPREISIEEGMIRQQPFYTLEALRGEKMSLSGKVVLDTDSFEIECTPAEEFELCFCNPEGHKLLFYGDRKEYCLDREQTSHPYNGAYGYRRIAHRDMKRRQKLRIFVDRSSIEIFADDGFCVFTSRFYLDRMNELRTNGLSGVIYKIAVPAS